MNFTGTLIKDHFPTFLVSGSGIGVWLSSVLQARQRPCPGIQGWVGSYPQGLQLYQTCVFVVHVCYTLEWPEITQC